MKRLSWPLRLLILCTVAGTWLLLGEARWLSLGRLQPELPPGQSTPLPLSQEPPLATAPTPGHSPADLNFNPGWIGAPCKSDKDCPYARGHCLLTGEGFPGGMCSQDCGHLCPDQQGARYAPTFCVESQVETLAAMCVAQCNLHLTDSGCRPGYVCTSLQRRGQSATRLVCLPDHGSRPPATACTKQLDALGLVYARPDLSDAPSRGAKLDDPPPVEGVCQLDTPILLASPLQGVDFRAKGLRFADHLLVSCALAPALALLSKLLASLGVVEVEHNGTYVCRGVAGSTHLSGHGRGLAIDVTAFERATGNPVSVAADWKGPSRERRRFLHTLVQKIREAKIFDLILTPASNAAHADHLHLELYVNDDASSDPAQRQGL